MRTIYGRREGISACTGQFSYRGIIRHGVILWGIRQREWEGEHAPDGHSYVGQFL